MTLGRGRGRVRGASINGGRGRACPYLVVGFRSKPEFRRTEHRVSCLYVTMGFVAEMDKTVFSSIVAIFVVIASFLLLHILRRRKSVVAIDCEMIRCLPPGGRQEKAVAVRCAIVSYDYKVLYNGERDIEYIRPPRGWTVTKWMAYHEQCYQDKIYSGIPFVRAREKILSELKGKVVVAHDHNHDFGSLEIDTKEHNITVYDTSVRDILRKMAGFTNNSNRMKLEDLSLQIFGEKIQRGTPHDPVKDAIATMKLYRHAMKSKSAKCYRATLV